MNSITIDELGRIFVYIEVLIIFLSSTYVSIPLAVNAIRWRFHGGMNAMRVGSALYSFGLAVMTGWILLIWMDMFLFNRFIFGSFKERTMFDMVIMAPLTMGSLLYLISFRNTLKHYREQPIDEGGDSDGTVPGSSISDT